MKFRSLFISYGNTASFIKRLSAFCKRDMKALEIEQVDIKDSESRTTILRHVSASL